METGIFYLLSVFLVISTVSIVVSKNDKLLISDENE